MTINSNKLPLTKIIDKKRYTLLSPKAPFFSKHMSLQFKKKIKEYNLGSPKFFVRLIKLSNNTYVIYTRYA